MHRLLRVGLSASISLLMLVAGAPPIFAPMAGLAAPTSPAFVQAASSTASFKVSFTKSVGAGDLLVAGITTNDGGTDPITAVSDNLNGAWTRLTSLKYGNGHVELWYFSNSVGGTDAVTFTSSNGSKQAFTIAEYSGVNAAAAPVDQSASKARTGSPTAGPTLPIGGAGELVIGVGGMSAPTSFSAGTGFTMRVQAVSNYLYANGLEDAISSSNAGQSMTMTPATNSSSYSGAIVAVFLTGPTPNPQATLVVSPSSGAAPLAVTADASGSSDPVGISTYTFAFGDGTTVGPQAGATATHSYTAGGNFTATVTIKDTAGKTATASAGVAAGAPVAVLKLTQGTNGLSFNADASGSSDPIGISSYTFNFGDGSALVGPQAGATTSHTYATAGTYTATVTAADSVGATATATASAVAQATPLIARLAVGPGSGLVPLPVTADASTSTAGTNPIASYTFNFGDGSPAVGPQAAATAGHTYSTTGAFTVTVTVTDTSGASATATAAVTVSTPPTAAVTVTPASGSTPLPVSADASASTAGSNPIASYKFNFGDGSAAVGPQPGATANHTYNAGGSYTVTLTVTDSAGYSSTATASVTATAPLTAKLTVNPKSGPAPLAVTADASGSTPGSNPIASYTFNFGDGSAAVGPQPGATANHTYSSGGTYTVTVTVTDSSGGTNAATANVNALTGPTAALTVTPASGPTPLPVSANASASTAGSSPIASYTFNFGDGSATVGPQPGASANHTYITGGTFTVTVVVADTAGQTSTAFASATAINGTVSGTVTDSASAAPIAGAQVSTQPATSTAVTNASGGYQLSIPAGAYNVIFSASGYNSNFKSINVSSGAGTTASQALVAVPALTAQDLFSRPNQTGIGPASDGHTWTDDLASNPSAVVQITNQQLYLQTTSTTYDAWMGIAYQDQEVAADVNISAGSARLLARVQGNGTWLVLTITPSSNVLVLWVAKNGTWTQLKSWAAAPVLTQNTWYHAKLRAVGANVYGKAWVFGSPEPDWQVSATQSQVTGTGIGGLRSSGSTGLFANFSDSPVTQVTGTVTDSATGQPIAGATVATGTGPTTTSISTGAYLLALTAGSYTVTASATGYTASSQSATVSTGVSTTASFALVATGPPPPPPGDSNIVGNVTDSVTGVAIVGAQVYTQPATTSVTTDSAGNYLLTILAGSYSVLFSAGQYNTDFGTVTTAVGGTSTVNMSLLRVPAGAAQDVFSRPDQSSIGIASDGRTWIDDHAVYPTGTEQIAGRRLWVQTAAATTDYDAWVGIPYQDQEVTLDFNATSGGIRVLGRVQASETWVVLAINPASSNLQLWAANNNVWTLLTSIGGIPVSQNIWYHAKLDVIGQKLLGKVWAFGTSEPGWQIAGTQTIVTGTGVAGLRFAGSDGYVTNFLEKPITQIAGTVSDSATGGPVSNASVSLSNGASTTTDITGAYVIGSLGAGTYTVTATAPGYGSSTQSATVSVGASAIANLTITATPGPSNSQISGVVTDSVSGAPIAGAQVSTQPASSAVVANASGGYTLAVSAGSYNVIFAAAGYNSNFKSVSIGSNASVTANQALVAVPGQTAQDLFSRPNQTGIGPATDGHAWTDDLASNPSAVVQIRNGQLYLQTSSTAYDAWMGIPYQDQEVAADVDMVAGGARLLARVQGSGNWIVLTITPGTNGGLSLWVAKNNTWTQLKSWTANPAFLQNTWYHAKLRAVGTSVSAKVWAFGAAEPAWQVSTTQSILTGSGVGGLRSSSATEFVANFSESPVTQVSGTVTSNATKQPIAGATVTLSNGATTTTDSQGNYVFANVSPGTYTVTASASGFTTGTQGVIVSTGISATANFAL
ncbi:MAG TPA: PKD domain-containing protein [Candidatus Dormibacteraeota bacterium]|nr:PKD domain-containing protein [Candidatus Dormibacteraeota bacterium]